MSEPTGDSLTFRNVPTGVTGIPRLREWDAVVAVELPELESGEPSEFEFVVPDDGAPDAGEAGITGEVLEKIAAALGESLERPFEGLAVRQDGRHWAAGGRSVRPGEAIDLPEPLPQESLEVVRTPDGDLVVTADGEPLEGDGTAAFEAAVAELDGLGRARFESFVARADRGQGGSWRVRVDPL